MVVKIMAKFHSIHIRHTYICQNHIYGIVFYKLYSFFSILAVTCKFVSQTIPIYAFSNGIPH